MKNKASEKIKAEPIQAKATKKSHVAARSSSGKDGQTQEKETMTDDAKKRALWKKGRRQFWSTRLDRALSAPAVSEKRT